MESGPQWDPSPIIHLHLSPAVAATSRDLQQQQLRRMSDVAFERYGVLLSCPTYSFLERVQPAPALRLYVCSAMGDKEVAAIAAAVRGAVKEVLGVWGFAI